MKSIQTLITLSATLGLAVSIASAEPLNVGDAAPKLKSVDQNGKEVDLGKELASGTSLVYFYPKADTPGCTKQACNLRDEFEAVKAAGIKVFGVSADTSEDQKKFEEKYTLPFTPVADKAGEVIKDFGGPQSDRGFASRQSFLVRDGKIIWRDLKANPTTQAQDAIAAAKAN
ncbi:MAG: peroxiredoxin [Verrucomicrobiae bacterium]|nr:peroxiredoxin [Verrucomicrobiae bacterium]